ncbi:MAG TPA: hypothetical protein PKW69_04020 [Niabella sp.]|nr:hypothetical protein [Niabella sp.]
MATIDILDNVNNEIDLTTIPSLEIDNYDLFDFEELKFDFDELFISVDENSTNFKLDENFINQKRIDYLEQKITPLLISLIKNEDFEFGKKNETVKLIEQQLEFNSVATQNWFNKLYIKYFASDEKILIGLLRIVESLNETSLHPTGEIMAIAALSHKNDEVKELGVRIFENWCSLHSYEILKSIKVETVWLQEYITQVIKDIEIELCLY